MGPAYRTRAGVLCKWSVTLPICRTTGLPTISSGLDDIAVRPARQHERAAALASPRSAAPAGRRDGAVSGCRNGVLLGRAEGRRHRHVRDAERTVENKHPDLLGPVGRGSRELILHFRGTCRQARAGNSISSIASGNGFSAGLPICLSRLFRLQRPGKVPLGRSRKLLFGRANSSTPLPR
jgi:hypothetical protein